MPTKTTWRSMSFAPKNGTKVLVKVRRGYRLDIIFGEYGSTAYYPKPTDKKVWYEPGSGSLKYGPDEIEKPLGWQPLPPLN